VNTLELDLGVQRTDGIERTAKLSADGLYRYELTRKWGDGLPVVFIGLNPSTADAETDDPTIRRCIAFAQRWGYGSLVMLNLFALRATDPAVMMAHPEPIGPENDEVLLRWVTTTPAIACWGCHGRHHHRDRIVYDMIRGADRWLYCLATNQDDTPAHPLYLPGNLVMQPYIRGEEWKARLARRPKQ
jgi:hypothetical protein